LKGKGDELAAILLEASRLVSNAKGIHFYIVSKDMADPDVILVMRYGAAKKTTTIRSSFEV